MIGLGPVSGKHKPESAQWRRTSRLPQSRDVFSFFSIRVHPYGYPKTETNMFVFTRRF
jgi:hypothetical protein